VDGTSQSAGADGQNVDLQVVVQGELPRRSARTWTGTVLQVARNASGTVSFVIEVDLFGRLVRVRVPGAVTCLAVEGHRAVIGFTSFIAPMKAVAVDNGSTGSPADEFGVGVVPADCSDESGAGTFPLSGDVVVRDAPTRAQCLDRGWRNYTDAAGQRFKNQGECIAFALGVS
jgi:hypothetical protein